MGYRNKTYVIFDADNDMWAYGFMCGWKAQPHMDFDFYDAHEIRPLTDRASEETVRRRLRERLGDTKQAIVLIGDSTRNLHRFVRWELEMCLGLQIPLVAANLNGLRTIDSGRCPPILRGKYVVHVSFNMAIIKHALDQFPDEFHARADNAAGDRQYGPAKYAELGLDS